jgi:hypothetical protein
MGLGTRPHGRHGGLSKTREREGCHGGLGKIRRIIYLFKDADTPFFWPTPEKGFTFPYIVVQFVSGIIVVE